MKLDAKEYKRYMQLKKLVASGKATSAEKDEFQTLDAKKKEGASTPAGNPVELWNKYPELFKDSTNIPFNYIKGTALFSGNYSGVSLGPTMPPIAHGARIEYVRTIGKSLTANDAFNYQMRKLWLAMHRKYRGIGTYEYADLGIAIFSIVNAFADLARAERIYGLFNNYKILNRTIPEGILAALGVEAVSVSGSDLADFRYQLNRIIQKAKTLCLPAGIGIVQSFLLLDGNVFCDSDSKRATWIVYDTPYYCEYDPTASTGGRTIYKARTKTGAGSTQSLTDIVTDLNYVFDALLLDTDIARICSDMLAAIGSEGLVTLSTVPEDWKIEPVRDDSRLLQLHNTQLVGAVGSQDVPNAISRVAASGAHLGVDTLQVYQDGGVIICNFSSVDEYYAASGAVVVGTSVTKWGVATTTMSVGFTPDNDTLIDIWKDDVSADDIMEMTRQSVISNFVSDAGSALSYRALHSYGNILCMNIELFGMMGGEEGSTAPVLTNTSKFDTIVFNMSQTSTIPQAFTRLGFLSQIDWHPIMFCYSLGTSATASTFNQQKHIVGDLDNCVRISSQSLSRLHDTAMLSGWIVPFAENVASDK